MVCRTGHLGRNGHTALGGAQCDGADTMPLLLLSGFSLLELALICFARLSSPIFVPLACERGDTAFLVTTLS
jgi:hypothetical protein